MIEGSKTRARNSEMESYASNKILPVKLTRVQPVIRGQVDTTMQDGIIITAVDDNTANMMEPKANVVEIESSLGHCQPEFINHYDSIGKKQENQNETTEKTSDILVHNRGRHVHET